MARNDPIVKAEQAGKFPIVADEFKVIDSNTVTAIVDQGLLEKLKRREKIDRNLIQTLSVQIWQYRQVEYALEPIPEFSELYMWTLAYDTFLGYMTGVLSVETFKRQGGSVV
jgi:CRISPR-associated endonuclease/helicase Cas3